MSLGYRPDSVELALQVRGSYEDVLRAARFADSRGLAAIAIPDHYLYGRTEADRSEPAWDAFAQLAGLARETERIGLVALVAPITFRHPAVLLKNAVSIDAMSGGRFSLGVGAGWLAEEHDLFGIPYPSTKERFEVLEEGLGYLRAGLSQPPEDFEGEHFRLRGFDMHPKPAGPLPLVVGGTGGVKTPRLAGLYADEFNVYANRPAVMRERIAIARSVASEAGRDPDALRVSTASPALVGTDEASFRKKLTEAARRFDRTPAELEKRWRSELGFPIGLAGDVAAVLLSWDDVGVSRYYAQLFGATDPDDLEEIVEVLGF